MIFHSHAYKTHFHKKCCALGLILKVRVLWTRKWPVEAIYTASIKTFSVSRIFYSKFGVVFLFQFLHKVHFISRKVALEIKRFDQFTLACSSNYFYFKKILYRRTSVSREHVSMEFNCRRISVIAHRSVSDKLAIDSLVLLVCGLSLITPKIEKDCLANCFQSKICKW